MGDTEKAIVRANVEGSDWTRNLTVTPSKSDGTATIQIDHKENWRRLNIYKLGRWLNMTVAFLNQLFLIMLIILPLIQDKLLEGIGVNYTCRREDWNLNVSGISNRYYYSSPDGKLFSDQLASTSIMLANILTTSKLAEYQNAADPNLALHRS